MGLRYRSGFVDDERPLDGHAVAFGLSYHRAVTPSYDSSAVELRKGRAGIDDQVQAPLEVGSLQTLVSPSSWPASSLCDSVYRRNGCDNHEMAETHVRLGCLPS